MNDTLYEHFTICSKLKFLDAFEMQTVANKFKHEANYKAQLYCLLSRFDKL